MTDATMMGGLPPQVGRNERWMPLFALGFAAGVGAVLAVSMLQTPVSLTDTLRRDRASIELPVVPRIPMSLLPTDLSPPPSPVDAADAAPTRVPVPELPARDVSAAPVPAFSVASLETEFDALDYRLADIRAQSSGVPRLVAEAVPGDLEEIRDIPRRKAVFFKMVLPLVLIANERLEADRARILDLRAQEESGQTLNAEDSDWLARQFELYRVEEGDWDILLRRVDVVPPSLAMAQAAIESGWGTSRFAREGNALFGQWVWGDDADGIVPEDRVEGMTHKIRAFDTPLQAVMAYIKNLNTHRAYREFRNIRANLRRQGAGINGMTLAEGLESYSEKGRDYIDFVRSIISVNKLRPFDRARLRDARA